MYRPNPNCPLHKKEWLPSPEENKEGQHYDLGAFAEFIDLRRRVDEANKNKKIAETDLESWIQKYCEDVFGEGVYELGGWECEDSPLDLCIYETSKDKYNDPCCIFCGGPEERK